MILEDALVRSIRLGTRGSILALAQSTWVKRTLEGRDPGLNVETVIIKTSGDRFLDTPVQAIGGKGVFTKEIEDALLRKEIDLAVHSMKDLPTELAEGLTIAAIPRREDPRDVLVSRNGIRLSEFPGGAKVGTGSLRRRAQILYFRRDLSVVPLRGNLDTRLRKLDQGEADGLIMAAAGLKRIGREDRITEIISEDICVSAVAQGALGLESREDDPVREQLSFLHHEVTCAEVEAERSFLRRLGGGCHVPVGAWARIVGDGLKLLGVVANPDGSSLFRGEISGPAAHASEIGRELAERLLRDGAGKIVALS